MKKTRLFLIMCILVSSLVLAQQGVHEPGTGITNPEVMAAGQGTGQDIQPIAANTGTQEQNLGEEQQIQNQVQVKTGTYTTENGQFQVQEQANNKVKIQSGEASAETAMEMTQEKSQNKTQLKVKLSNGKNAEVKVMPDTASETALERLRVKVCSEENNCQIELKEVGQGKQVKAAYEVQLEKQAKLLGLFKTKMQVQAQVDAENGEVLQTKKPWWAFLASEPEE